MGSNHSQTEAVLREVELFPGISRERRGHDPTAYGAGILDDEDESLDSVRDRCGVRTSHERTMVQRSAYSAVCTRELRRGHRSHGHGT